MKAKGGIVITQPRRVAAISLAKRVAEEMQVVLGEEVGYSVRFDELTSHKTRITFVTDGMLLRKVLSDPGLSKYSTIILDEAHERTLRTDILFGIVRHLQAVRKSLKVVIMSATLDPAKFADFFADSHTFRVPGRQFPVRILYTAEPQQDYLDAAILSIFQIHMERPAGDILVFLTGQEEIEAVEQLLNENASLCPRGTLRMVVCPVHASLPSHQQVAIFKPTPGGCRKVVLATNIAETSITIPGVRYVIDPGFVKMRIYNPRSGMETLSVHPSSKASLRQRCGRAGRESAGECFRLFTEDAFKTLEDETPPEILRSNLANVILIMKASGIKDVLGFSFVDPPPRDALLKGLEELFALGALDRTGAISAVGRLMAECPLSPQLSRVLLESQSHRSTGDVLTVVSMLSVENLFMSSSQHREQATAARRQFRHPLGDHLTLCSIYRAYLANKCSSKWCVDNYLDARSLKQVTAIRSQLVQFCEKHRIDALVCAADSEAVLKSFAAGFFLQTAFLQADGTYRTVLGRQQAHVHPSSVLHGSGRKSECVLFHELTMTSKCYMRAVSVVEPAWIAEYSKK